MAGSLPLMACSLRCCDEHRCIGIFHKKDQTDNCYLISATEEDTGCADFDWAIWTAYKKRKDLGQCGSLLMDTVGYYHLADSSKVAAETSRLNYVPNSINEIGGFLYDTVYLLVKLSSAAKVRGTVIQGRWRDEALALCCDERVTEYFINWSPDCDSSWTFYPASNTGTIYFEGNVIPGAGNEAVVNLFDEPVVGICFAFYVQSYHLQAIVRWDLIGCEL
ncbi:uncharacterized protein LOC132733743 [Ruditapes philippinarum]|uniref:uncharacterized protein LOC132733743 n=1 Tax=Ruditapes philippinarum TaxID=129788 RepID=UPI00295A7A50|nr:uncharacterized protein LOC132733743 [Ruditapes philippinarum]